MSDYLDPPRWPNGPPICTETNLPAFHDLDALHAYFAQLPSVRVKRTGKCAKCGYYHAETEGPDDRNSGIKIRGKYGNS